MKITATVIAPVFTAQNDLGIKRYMAAPRERQLYRDDRPGVLYRCDSVWRMAD
ncbi:hypothetical protein KCP71_25155 [Salmonella enterica subsp. enterica]|nr:hypothetical protein KCP71_25155 [Salmonella enterica subsp. enterica]